jgi:hypothetical protein
VTRTRGDSALGARLDLRTSEVDPGGELAYTVSNHGVRQLLAGAAYGFEKRTAGVWRAQPTEMWFTLIGLRLPPGGRTRPMSASVPDDFGPGRYRLTTSVTLMRDEGGPERNRDNSPVNYEISAEFTIRAG